jgi:sterol desaturase/sphingolipid hydroxylase (fatty acid hydroxylase superfamily)
MTVIASERLVGVEWRARAARARLSVPSLALAGLAGWLVWFGADTVARGGELAAVLRSGWAELVAPGLIALVVAAMVCEQVWPAQRRPLLARGHVHDACFFVVYAVCAVPIMTLMGVAFATLLRTHAPWLEAPTSSWSLWVLVPVTLVLMDGANWTAHWADHRLRPLWRFHAVHHSQEELSVLTSFRAHPVVHTAGFFLATIPVLALMGNRAIAPVLITGYVCLGTLPHANVRWTFGPVGKVIVSPGYHRIHHAIGARDGANLGIALTVWDVLAGRAVFPSAATASAATGLAGRPLAVEQGDQGGGHVRRLARQLLEPFTQGA